MARQRIKNLTEPGSAGWNPLSNKRRAYNENVSKRRAEEDINSRVDRRQEIAEALKIPGAMGNEFTRSVGDRYVDAERYVQSPEFARDSQMAALVGAGVLAAGTGAAYLGARNQQQVDYQPTDPFSVAGRMVSNLNVGQPVGTDVLAEARNKVSQARQLVGTEAMLEALTVDEVNQLRGEQEMAMTPMEIQQMADVQSMIDTRASQLMGTPIQKSDGSVAPMPYDTAQRLATEQVAMELRANQVY